VSNALSRRQKIRKNLSICTKTSPEDEEEAIVTSAKIRNTTTQIFPPDSVTDIIQPEVVWDSGNFTSLPNILTAPVGGIYLIGIFGQFQGPFPPSTFPVSITAQKISPVEGIFEAIQLPTQAPFVASSVSYSTLVELLSGESVKFTFVNNDTTNTMTWLFGNAGRGAWMVLTEIT